MGLTTQLSDSWRDWPLPAKAKLLERLQELPTPRAAPAFRGNNRRFQEEHPREVILTGPTRTGKTMALLYKPWKMLNQYPGMRSLLIRKKRVDLSETALVTLEQDIIGIDHPLVTQGPSRDYRKNYTLDNGSTFVIGGLDKPGKVLSAAYDFIVVPQAEELYPGDWEVLITRLAGTAVPPEYQQLAGDCNPSSPLNWIMQRSLSQRLELWQTYHTDNPMLWDEHKQEWTERGRVYLDSLRASLTGVLYERLFEGKWVQAEGVVYADFGQENICSDEPVLFVDNDAGEPQLQPWEIALDDGYIDPRVFLFIQRTGSKVLVFDEIYHSRHLEETCVRELQDKCAKYSGTEIPKELEKASIEERAVWCRESGVNLPEIAVGAPEAKSLHKYLRLADIPVRNQPIPSVVEALKPVRMLVKDGQGYRTLQVNKRCNNLINEMTDGYKYPPEGKGKDDEKPVDENNHACDALRDWTWTRARTL